MPTLAQRVEAPFSVLIGLDWPHDQPERRLLRDTYRILVRKLPGAAAGLSYGRVDRHGRMVDPIAAGCYEIGVDGRVAGVLEDHGDHGWFVRMTNEDGAHVTGQMPQALGAMVRAFANRAAPDADAVRVFDEWSLVAEANAKVRSHRFFGDLDAGLPNTTDPDRRGFQPA